MIGMKRRLLTATVVLICAGSLQVRADGTPAERAAEMMARAQALDLKCSILNAHDRDKLSKFTARAELALASRQSIESTKATMQRGRDAAQAAACSPEEKAVVQQILSAALQATGEDRQTAKLAQSPAPVAADAEPAPQPLAKAAEPMRKAEIAKPEVTASATPLKPEAVKAVQADPAIPMAPATPAPAAMTASVSQVDTAVAVAPLPSAAPLAKKKPAKAQVAAAKVAQPKKPAGGLATYEQLTEAYYKARRCGGGNLGGAYQAIVAEHGRVMASHSAAEVSAALHRAETRAANSSCS